MQVCTAEDCKLPCWECPLVVALFLIRNETELLTAKLRAQISGNMSVLSIMQVRVAAYELCDASQHTEPYDAPHA